MSKCPDCGAAVGSLHDPGCDVETCPCCGRQAISCRCAWDAQTRRIAWQGEPHGSLDAVRLGWFARLVPGLGWIPCAPDHPDAAADLNRLMTYGRWDQDEQHWRAI